MTSQTGKQRTTIHTLPNISRSKGNKTVKYGKLIEYNMRNILLEKSCTKYGGETSLRPLFKKSKLSIPLDQQSETLQFVLIIVKVEIYQNMIKLRCWSLRLTLCKAILKTKRGLELVSLPNFLHDLKKKIFLTLYSILLADQISFPDCLYFLRHWAVCVL